MSWRWGHLAGKDLYMMSYRGHRERAALSRLLRDKEVTLGGYVPERTWIVAADAASARTATALPGIKVVSIDMVIMLYMCHGRADKYSVVQLYYHMSPNYPIELCDSNRTLFSLPDRSNSCRG